MIVLTSGVLVLAIAGAPRGAQVVEEALAFDVESVYGARRAMAGTQETYYADSPHADVEGDGMLADAILDLLEGVPQIDLDVERAIDVGAAVAALHTRDPWRSWSREWMDRATTRWDGARLVEWFDCGAVLHVAPEMTLMTAHGVQSVSFGQTPVDELSLLDDVFSSMPEVPGDPWIEVEEPDGRRTFAVRVDGADRALVKTWRADHDGFGEEIYCIVFERVDGRMLPIAEYEQVFRGARLTCIRYALASAGEGERVPFPVETVQFEASLPGAAEDWRMDGPTVVRTRMVWRPRPTSWNDVRLPIHADSILRVGPDTLTPEEEHGFFRHEMASWPQRVLDAIKLR